MAYICLSYTPASRELAEQVHRRLEANDFRVWRREPDLGYSDAASAAILDAAFKGAAVFVFIWSEGETVPAYLSEDYHVAQTFKRPIYFVNRANQIDQLIAALRQVVPDVSSFGPLPAPSMEQPSAADEMNIPRSGQIVRLLSIAAAGLGALTLIALFLLAGRDDAREIAPGTPPTAEATAQLQVGGGADQQPAPSATAAATSSLIPTLTSSPTATFTMTPSATVTPSTTFTPSSTATPTLTHTPTTTPTATPTLTPIPLLIQPTTAPPTAFSTFMPLPTDAPPVFATNTPFSITQATFRVRTGR
ncbi:MAG: hypothetical protein ACUVS2_00795 [Candidatus Flexifilum sp.]